MALQFRTARIPLDQIDLDDTTCVLDPTPDAPPPPALIESVSRIGILHPPILQGKNPSSYRVVAGRKRLRALSSCCSVCDCLLLAANTPPQEVLAVALEETRISRRPTPVELAIFFKKCQRWLDDEQLAARFLPSLRLAANAYQLRRLLDLLKLEEPLLLALHEGRLEEGVARELLEIPFADRMSLFDLIDVLSLSVGNQKKLVTGCRELSRRQDTSVGNILADPALRAILHNEASNPPQKATQLMAWLTDQRLPRLREAEKNFRRFCGKLDLLPGMTLRPAQSFEKDSLTLTIDFADRDQLAARWQALRAALDNHGHPDDGKFPSGN